MRERWTIDEATRIAPLCHFCSDPEWCSKHGCSAWNQESQRKKSILRKLEGLLQEARDDG